MTIDSSVPAVPSQFAAPSLEPAGTRSVHIDDFEESLRRAGWSNHLRLTVKGGDYESLSWSNLRTLVAARDEKLAKRMNQDPAGAMRNAWLALRGLDGNANTPIELPVGGEGPHRVLLLGDTGDGSEAQAAVAEHLHGRAGRPGALLGTKGVAAVLVESDVVYPAGAYAEYQKKFHRPYEDLRGEGIPIYAVPGNHDWNDGSLSGFMAAFCGATAQPQEIAAARRLAAGAGLPAWRARRPFWHDSDRGALPASSPPPGNPAQSTPYLALDVGGVLFIGVDTGYGNFLDPEQAKWLVALVEEHAQAPKLLFSGKPLIVNGKRAPCCFKASFAGSPHDVVGPRSGAVYRSVDDVVRRPENRFVAAIGGDVHNYQRYFAHISGTNRPNEHVLPYLVCGGGGVFIGQTAWLDYIAIVDSAGDDFLCCDELEVRLFPRRAHSRLYLDAVIHQAARRVRFTLPIALLAAAASGLVLWPVSLVLKAAGREQLPLPSPAIDAAFILSALAVNISARPISRGGRLVALGTGGAAAGISAALVRHGLALDGRSLGEQATRGAVFGGLMLGQLLLQAGESPLLSRSPALRVLGVTVSAAAGAAIVAGSGCAVLANAPDSGAAKWLALGVGLAALALTAAPWLLVGRISIEDAHNEAELGLEGNPPRSPRKVVRRTVGNWLARNQRFFSFFETFTNGRLTQKAKLKGWPVRTYMPLYRSYLEIEFRRAADEPEETWDFGFTAYGVTGEDTADSGDIAHDPVIIDSFRAHLTGDTLSVTTRAVQA
jgi:hypothetical protein